MLPRTFLTQLIPSRVAEALRRVEKRIWHPLTGVPLAVEQTESLLTHRRADELGALRFERVPAAPFHWGPKFAQRWFRVTLPAVPDQRQRYLVWEDQAEATAYVDGAPYYGLDLAHRHCPLPAGISELLVEAVCIKTGIWLKGSAAPLDEAGSLFAPPHLVQRDDTAWEVYHDLRVLLEVLEIECDDHQPGAKKPVTDLIRHSPPILRASPLFRRWCAQLDRAIDLFDRDGLAAFGAELKKIYADFPAERDALRAVLTGHAHIDLVWLWPERVGEFKAVHSWATQTRLMVEYPEFRFGYSQPASYAAVARRAPALYKQVKRFIASGQWEATGGSYVEFDTQLPAGEGLLRCLRIGQQEFRSLRGTPSKVCWLPDVFGYTGALPQLLRGFGIESFFTTKLSWNTVNQMPHTSFRWRGSDGSTVRAHVVLLHDYNEAVDIRRLREDALHHQQAAVHPEFLVPTGYGDGGGGPTEEMCERARRISNLAGAPRTEWGNIEAFFERMAPVAADLPEVGGELLFELHRGVFTTHGRLKSAFRRLERSLQTLEAIHVARGQGPIDETLWRRLLFAQFHDHLPGSSIWEVYAEGIPELEHLADLALANGRQLLSGATTPGWFNPLPVSRTWVEDSICYDLLPLCGGNAAALKVRVVNAPKAEAQSLASDRVAATFNAQGEITRLQIDGHDIPLADTGHSLWAYSDHPAKFEAWDIDRTSLSTGAPATLTRAAQIEIAGLTASVTFTYRVAEKSTVAVRYSVTSGEAVLRIDYDVDWHDPETLLKGIISTRYVGSEARYGAPFGSTLRGQWPGHAREEAQWSVPASRWMIVMDDAQSEGLAVITESKYGFTVRDGVVGVSLLRSAYITGADEHPEIRDTPDRPRHSDLGRQKVRMALGRFSSDLAMEDQPAVLADTLFTPCVSYGGEAITCGLLGVANAPSLAPSWAEPLTPKLWVLRLHETLGRRGTARIDLAPGWQAQVVKMDITVADAPSELPAWKTGTLPVAFGPYQVLSVAFSPTSDSRSPIAALSQP